jgi:hypothetical protein
LKSKFFILISLTANFCFNLHGQSTEQVKSVFQIIEEELPKYAVKNAPVFGMSTEGGEATGYYKDGVIQKLSVVFLGESGKRSLDYYYKNEKIVFVLSTSHNYNRPIYYTKKMAEEYGEVEYFDIEKTRMTKERFYLSNDRVLIWLDNDRNSVPMGMKVKKTKAEELSSTSKKLQELLAT